MELKDLYELRKRNLDDSVCLHQFMRESGELEQWINEQLQVAMSEEYGHDYEHFEVILDALSSVMGSYCY